MSYNINVLIGLGVIYDSSKLLLWTDELGDVFILCKWGEIYGYSETEIRCYIWTAKMYLWLKKEGLILWEDPSDDQFHTVNIKRVYLSELLRRSGFKRRPDINGKWLKEKEKRLGHRILKYSPQSFDKLSSNSVQSGGEK